MARRATKETFVYEPVGLVPGDDTEVRRKVFAGDVVQDNWRAEDEGAVEEVDLPMHGLGAAPQAYKSQLDETGAVHDDHLPEHQQKAARGRKPAESRAAAKSDK